ncbi:hypothetical protein GA0074692_6442 [Micromonospora pallida]|uniref:Uncharacterized protein n=1 Tax=Micromonospora pallida TaxID=145854 RepID=A0A1C6TIV8_9ACTN|nr:hypothetical protein [Micromonospora pallida]SCL41681.1 hypothetical protein GA0074692_6442 [Micromonospora pallida]
MEKRHAGTLAVIALMACLAVVGAVGGTYLANRANSQSDDPSVDPTPSRSVTIDPASSETADPDSSESPEPSESAGEAEPRTYQIDREVYDALSLSVTLVSAEVTSGGKLRLNVRYRNDSLIDWPLACPTAEVDRTSSQVTLSDGRTVRPENSWCATTRPGKSFTLASGAEATTWALYPAVPAAGSSFDVTWYDFPVIEDVRLR